MGYQIPLIYEETHKGERSYDVWSRLLKDRIVFISGYISTDLSNIIIAQLLFLNSQEQSQPVQIYLNSGGGETMACLAIYDAMSVIGLSCHTYCVGQCAGEATLLLAAGVEKHRYAMPHSRLMLRQPRGSAGGQASDIAIQAKEVLNLKQKIYERLAHHTQQKIEKIEQDAQRDFFLTAQMAQEYGLIDHILKPSESHQKRFE